MIGALVGWILGCGAGRLTPSKGSRLVQMNSFDRTKISGVYETLLRAKLGSLYDWEQPALEETVGPFDPTPFEHFERARNELAIPLLKTLKEISDPNLAILSSDDLPDPSGRREAWVELLRERTNRLSAIKPSWLQGGFGHPGYAADFEYWGQMPEYSLHEALMLSVGVEPKHFGEKRIDDAKKTMDRKPLIPSIEFLVRRHEQFYRKFPTGPGGKYRVGPAFLFDWFTDVSMAVHSKFMERLQRRAVGEQLAQPGVNRETSLIPLKADKREIDKVAQLFVAMAIDHLGYNPMAKRSPIPKEITDLAASMGLTVSDDTVRKYLKLGAKFIPEGWEPS